MRASDSHGERLRLFNDTAIQDPVADRQRLQAWMERAKVLGVAALDKFFKTLTNWLDKIGNYFHSRSSDGRTEGFNHGLRAILWRAFGMTNFGSFRLRVCHYFGFASAQSTRFAQSLTFERSILLNLHVNGVRYSEPLGKCRTISRGSGAPTPLGLPLLTRLAKLA